MIILRMSLNNKYMRPFHRRYLYGLSEIKKKKNSRWNYFSDAPQFMGAGLCAEGHNPVFHTFIHPPSLSQRGNRFNWIYKLHFIWKMEQTKRSYEKWTVSGATVDSFSWEKVYRTKQSLP